jgi:hypothetical protein
MGSEFQRKQAAAYKKRLDHSLLALGTADLFTQNPTRAPRIIAAELVGSICPKAGEDLVIQRKGKALIALQGLTEVAMLESPPLEVAQFVEDSCGVAKGIVEVVHDEAAILEISIC